MNKSAFKLCFAALALLLVSLNVVGQIRIPKIGRPRPSQPAGTPTTPTNTNAPAAEQPSTPDAPAPVATGNRRAGGELYEAYGNYVDDGFTWFESVATQELDAKQMAVPTGWTLKSWVRPMGAYPKHSAFKFVVSRAGKVLGTTRCEASSYNIPSNNPADVSFVFADGCGDKAAATKETGKFGVEVFFIDGATNAERGVRKYRIEVLQVERVKDQTGKFAGPDSPRYVISRHAEAPISFLYLRPAYALNYTANTNGSNSLNQVEVYFGVSPYKDINSLRAKLRCTVDGKPLQLPGDGYMADLVDNNAERRYEEIYSDRLAAKYQTGPRYQDSFGFELVRATLPLTYGGGRAAPGRLNLSDYPGRWECSMRDEGERLRTWRWAVGADGMPIRHTEQGGNVNLHPNSYLIETEIPAGGSAMDKRLAPASAAEGFFYGQPWATPEGRAAASKVTAKGSPAPVPSNRVK